MSNAPEAQASLAAPGEPDRSDHVRIGLAAAAVLGLVYLVDAIMLPFLFAGAIAFLATPLLDRLSKWTRLPRSLCASLLFLLIVAAGAIAGLFAVPRAVHEGEIAVGRAEPAFEAIARMVIGDHPRELLGLTTDPARLAHASIAGLLGWLHQFDTLATLARGSIVGLSRLSLTLVLLFYFLIDGPRIAGGLLQLLPPALRRPARDIGSRLGLILRRYFVGVLIVAAYAGAAAYVGLGLILGVRHAVLLASLTALLELVPVIGAIIAATIAGLVALQSATGAASIVAYAVYATVLRVSVDQVAEPLILGSAARLHPVVLIFSFLVGLGLFGIPGAFMAVPGALAIKHALILLYGERA